MMASPSTLALPSEWSMHPKPMLRALLATIFVCALILVHNLALLMVLGLALSLGLALQERVRSLEAQSPPSTHTFSGSVVADGGSFTSLSPDRERPMTQGVSVLDGGSLESLSLK